MTQDKQSKGIGGSLKYIENLYGAMTMSEERCIKCKSHGPLCADLYCRDCHISLSFEECVSGDWAREIREKALAEAGVTDDAE